MPKGRSNSKSKNELDETLQGLGLFSTNSTYPLCTPDFMSTLLIHHLLRCATVTASSLYTGPAYTVLAFHTAAS